MLKPKDLIHASPGQRYSLLSRGEEGNEGNENVLRKCVLQFGGDNAAELVEAINIAKPFGYTQYDLNCGCPSIETNAKFGAALMKRPTDVAIIVEQMVDTIQKNHTYL